ncbi:hypothetical protein VCUG_01756 [Vavraia culicis subsp. floridensis]|uniref:GLTSCR protein conserved domain-containing protein n=1 Tax=Vavraia culicis (isolate floridensis) TaxID=948595 RepID=L2GUE4_VAVCU|nr:uncharacterized protein VCUG_01756 [Vavraia culicis subsp. floridensis]ELA46730.1 hypothetical protein VCUG_01756 [Vavraia culicis subsp. floridensis]
MNLTTKSTKERKNSNEKVDGPLPHAQIAHMGRRGRKKKLHTSTDISSAHNLADQAQSGTRKGAVDEHDADAFLSDRTDQSASLVDNIDHIICRRERILNFLYKDQYQLTHPDIRPFENTKHVYEYLLPYHIYNAPSYDDLLFRYSHSNEKLMDEIREITERITHTLHDYECADDDNIVIDLLLTEEQKFLTGRLSEYLREQKRKPRKSTVPKKRRKNSSVVKLNVKGAKTKDTKVKLRLETYREC